MLRWRKYSTLWLQTGTSTLERLPPSSDLLLHLLMGRKLSGCAGVVYSASPYLSFTRALPTVSSPMHILLALPWHAFVF